MGAENIGEWVSNFSWEEIFSGNIDIILPLIYLIILIAIYSIIIYHFYQYIARRDCFKPSTGKHPNSKLFLKYFLGFPLVAIVFFMGFALMLIFLTKTYEIVQLLLIAVALIVSIRISAYYTENLSQDVAKMLPFALLGVFLVDPTYFTWEVVQNRFNALPENVNIIIQLILFIVVVEWILRISLVARNKILVKKEKTQLAKPETS